MYKLNKFTHFIIDGDNTILFNLQTEAFIVLNKELSEFVSAYKDNIGALENQHIELFQQMQEKEFVIPAEKDEVASMITKWKELDNDSSNFSMIINPTLGCNLRCWYCYEKHDNKNIMKATVINSIYRLIEKKVNLPKMKSLNPKIRNYHPIHD